MGSRVIMVVVQVGAVKIYVAAVEVLRKIERGDETKFSTKLDGKTSLDPSYFVL
jgi:predicted DNA-binding protein